VLGHGREESGVEKGNMVAASRDDNLQPRVGPRLVWHPSSVGAVWKLTRGCTRTRPGVKTGAGANSHPRVPIGPVSPKLI
jgi:hypothetical protein